MTTYQHYLIHFLNNARCVKSTLENGRLSDRYRIGTDTGRIVSNRIGCFCIGPYYMHHCRFSSW